jgi:hypothetical protein
MALQALAKYQHIPEVAAATVQALDSMSRQQNANGGFTSWGSTNVESTVQVLVALCELGLPFDDPRFVKSGNTLLDNIMSFRNTDGSFSHNTDASGNSQMSTEQAFYAFVAVQRLLDGRNSLYRMSDTVRRGVFAPIETVGLPGKHVDIRQVPVSSPGRTFTDVRNHTSRQAIESLASRGIINGRSDTLFDPDATMTRAEFAAVITRGLGLSGRPVTVFSDIASSAWYASPVGAAFYYEIVTGTTATTFDPHGTITRQEAAVMVTRAARLTGMDTALGDAEILNMLAMFGDYRTVAAWAQAAMAFCYREGILDDSEFDINPSEPIRRGEIAGMLYMLLDRANLL